jgi:integrase
MASFRKRGELQWQARIARKGFPPQVKTFNSKAEAEAWAATVESAMARGIFINSAESERTTLREAFERYGREITVQKKSAAQENSRIKIILAHPLALRSLSSLRSSDVASYRDLRLKTVGAQTVVHDLNLISNLFNIARKEWGMENLSNPVELVKKPKLPNGRNRRLVGDEETRLLRAAGASKSAALKPLILVALETAMRLGEMLSLTWGNINLEKGVASLTDTKNGESRQVPLSSTAIEILAGLPRNTESDRVFWAWTAIDSVKGLWRRVCDKSGVDDFHFHDLRHEATSRLFERGFNPMEVASITGHKTLQMLKRYTHLRAEDLARRMR